MSKIFALIIFTIIFVSEANGGTLFSLSENCLSDYRSSCVAAHNKYRLLHNTKNLTPNKTLDAIAEKYAIFLATNNIFNHSKIPGYGENLSYLWSTAAPNLKICRDYCKRFVKMWYDEIKFYNYKNPVFSEETGHFTQLIWKSTTQIGCGLAIDTQNRAFGVCNYASQGNIVNHGFYQANVLPLRKSQKWIN